MLVWLPCLAQEPACHVAANSTEGQSLHTYSVPELSLINAQGQRVQMQQLIRTDKAVALQFIFTTCSTVCPALSNSLAQLQQDRNVLCISVSIDPEFDTPARLLAYGQALKARPDWQFLTGTIEQVAQLQRAFDAYQPGKQQHLPLTFLRPANASQWLRIEGFPSGPQLQAHFKKEPPAP